MSQNRKKAPSGNKIASYWNDRLMEKHEDGTFYCNNLDIGEPACQACGCWQVSNPSESDWNLVGLEKAHIIPWASGGSDEPSNFLMLCRHCHFDFDNEVERNDMKDFIKVSKWLKNRPQQKNDKIKSFVSNHVKENNYDKNRFTKAFALACSKVKLGKEKSLIAYIQKICATADAIYMTLGHYDHLNTSEFLEEISKESS